MIRKYHNHKPQTTPWHHEEKSLNHDETPGRQFKQSNQLPLPHQADCNTRVDIKSNVKKNVEQLQTPTMGVKITNSQQQNHRLRTSSSLSHQGALVHFTGTKSSPNILLLLKYKKFSARMEAI